MTDRRFQLAMSVEGWEHVMSNEEDRTRVLRMADPVHGFREFLNVWCFQPEGEKPRILGEVLWPAQEKFVDYTENGSWIYFLKARKLGETTIECAFDGWVMRFRDMNARVHLFSRRDDAAQELLAAVKYGMDRLPGWLKLGKTERDTVHEYSIRVGPDDRRMAKAYPADNDTAVEATCTHGHVDEWARMSNPRRVWQAIEPSMSGTCHFVTTGLGPQNYASEYWRRCMAGDAPHTTAFIGALERPDRDDAWLRAKRAGMDESAFMHEYPMKWEDALSGGGEFTFSGAEIDAAYVDCRGFGPARPGRKYVKGWDIGRHQDAAVGVVLDVTDDVHDVVAYRRLRKAPYPIIQREIEMMDAAYPGPLGVEKNSAGEAVLENLNLPEKKINDAKFTTSASSKARIISQLKVALQNQLLKWDPDECPQLDGEMRGYQQPDDNVVQDSVIALAIAEEYASKAYAPGRILRVMNV